jgi:hypothetical protein
MEEPIILPSILVTELLTSGAAKNDDVGLLGWSGDATLLLPAEQSVDVGAFPIGADREIRQ